MIQKFIKRFDAARPLLLDIAAEEDEPGASDHEDDV